MELDRFDHPDACEGGRAAFGPDESLFQSVVEFAPYATLLVRPDGIIGLVNAEAERVFGYSRHELVGARLQMLIPERSHDDHLALRAVTQTAPEARLMGAAGDLYGRRKDGVEIPIEIGLKPVLTDHGPSLLAAITDISVRKRSESELRHLNTALATSNRALRAANAEITRKNAEIVRKNEEVESFVYIVSHDLRAPLVNLQGFSRELELSCAELEAAVQRLVPSSNAANELLTILQTDIPGTLRFIAASVGKFDKLISSLLKLSRTGRQQYRRDPLDVHVVLQTALDMLRLAIESAGAEIDIHDLPAACADATALEQVFANLIENALKYAEPSRPLRIGVGGSVTDDTAQYWVRDNGLGIPPHAHARLFQVFQRFHPDRAKGDGVGLAAIKRIIECLGGKIWAADAPGGGAIFYFTLPHSTLEAVAPC